tara:strand:- start:1423 stop:3576 length:2154 start_codon:yes stop_codon:yes gene_type:complete
MISILFSSNSVNVTVIEQNKEYVLIEYAINDFTITPIYYDNELYHKVELDDEPQLLIEGAPELPHINRSLIIPDLTSASVEVVNLNYDSYSDLNILPSKGNVLRNVDINSVPHVKGDVYTVNSDFPANIYELKDPYILRDFRGQVIQLNPFQYNPITQDMKVFTNVTLRINFNGYNSINQFFNRRSVDNIVNDYSQIYSNRFINYETYQTRYNPISEDGEMLIICYDDFCDEMDSFVNWKNQKGIKTTLVPKSQAGNTASNIKNYVQNFYNTHNLTYLLLVGDKAQIPTFDIGSGWSSGESDISYAYLSGNDSYPEFFVGRFSAQTPNHVLTEVQRTIEYERDPQLGADWYKKGIMIASNEGAGAGHDGGESDWQHAQNMRQDLLNYTYDSVSELYDGTHGDQDSSGNPSDSMVRNAINSGAGIIHYTGHGDTDVWVTSNFNTGDVDALTNNNELPFVCTVGCKSGDFGGTCLGERFIYSTNGNEPTGAIATFMSTIYQSWAPPMEAQDEMVDILTESFENNRKYSFGGISWNGCLEMNDNYGNDGATETNHWTLFGDPSVSVRTDSPSTLSISHSGNLDPSDGAYEVIVNGNHDNVLVALSNNGQYLGSAYSNNGSAVIIVEEDVNDLNELTLTATGYNTTTVIDTVVVGGGECADYSPGDINGDSIFNVQDIVLLVGVILGSITPDSCQFDSSDLNSDSIVNIQDVVILVNVILS